MAVVEDSIEGTIKLFNGLLIRSPNKIGWK